MKSNAASAVKPADEVRRRKILEASLSVFARYGYRKASLDEVARAAGISRQGLYLHFPSKEDLFRASVQYALEDQSSAASAVLADEKRPIEARLVAALNEWLGRYVGVIGADASDLIETSAELTGALMAEHQERFERAVARAIENSPLMPIYARAGLSAAQLAQTLHATARGFKHGCASREAFVENITVAVRVLGAPLRKRN